MATLVAPNGFRRTRSQSRSGGLLVAVSPLVNTRISRREHRPRRLRVAKDAANSSTGGTVQSRLVPAVGSGTPLTATPPGRDAGSGGTCSARLDLPARGRGARSPPPRTEQLPGGPRAVFPRHVRACQHSVDARERWFVWTWPKDRNGLQLRVPYSCDSWRCPVCRRHEAAVTFARIKEATSRPEYSPSGWVYMVLTLDRDGYYSGRPWPDVTGAYRALSRMTDNLLHRLRRRYGGEPSRSWVGVVEAHRSGWPHMNLLLYAPTLAAELAESQDSRRRQGESARQSILAAGPLLRSLEECGWGRQSTAEGASSANAIAGYIVKLAGDQDATMGELAKITQAPTNAPARFRRLRSGKGFLPPRRHNPNVTGVLLRRRRSMQGDWEIVDMNATKDAAQQEAVAAAVNAEHELIEEEEALLAVHRLLPPMPPLRRAVRGRLDDWRHSGPDPPGVKVA